MGKERDRLKRAGNIPIETRDYLAKVDSIRSASINSWRSFSRFVLFIFVCSVGVDRLSKMTSQVVGYSLAVVWFLLSGFLYVLWQGRAVARAVATLKEHPEVAVHH